MQTLCIGWSIDQSHMVNLTWTTVLLVVRNYPLKANKHLARILLTLSLVALKLCESIHNTQCFRAGIKIFSKVCRHSKLQMAVVIVFINL